MFNRRKNKITNHDKKKNHDLRTGNQFLEQAEVKGATVTPSNDGFFKVTTPEGSFKMAGGDTILDKPTIAHNKKWFRILGLLVSLGILALLNPNSIVWVLLRGG